METVRAALARVAFGAVRRLPPATVRPLGRLARLPGLRSAARLVRTLDVTIERGEAAGLRLNAAGMNVEYVLGTVEPLTQEALARLLRPGAVFYDVGAAVGFFTILAARLVGESGHVYAFEPLPANIEALRHNVALNGFTNVSVRGAAVSDRVGSGVLTVVAERPDIGRLETIERREDAMVEVPVELVTLDAEIESGSRPPSVVKIDVEGAELEVLDGMRVTLERHRPIVLCEMHGRNREVAERLRPLGYELTTLEGQEPVEDAAWWVHVLAEPRS